MNNPNTTTTVSVVIATYNRGMMLVETIERILADPFPNVELIVVDQTRNYEPRVQQKLDKLRAESQFKLIQLDQPSLTIARNTGLLAASGDVVIYCDDDVAPSAQYIRSHVEAYADPGVGGVAGRVRSVLDAKMNDPEPSVGRVRPDGSFIANFHRDGPRGEVDFGIGCNMSFRRKALMDVGGFDERYRGNFYREEGDAFARVKAAGWKIVFEPDAMLDHLIAADGGCRKDRYIRRMYSNFRNETLFYFNCMSLKYVARFFNRILRWIWATVRVDKLPLWYCFYFILGAIEGMFVHFFLPRHQFSKGFPR